MLLNFQLKVVASFLLIAASPVASGPSSLTYYYKYFATKDSHTGETGPINVWYNNDNSWGVEAPEGQGFVAMVHGEDWGTTSHLHQLPKKLNDVNRSHCTWFNQNSNPAPGSGYDATYDIFIDEVEGPTDRNSNTEIMIWVGYGAPNSPLTDHYGADGKALPWATNVQLVGKSWDVYLFHWQSGARTISYLDRSNSGWFAGSLSPFFDHGIENGWFTGDQYLNSVMAGWEFGHGSYSADHWGAIGF